MLEQKHSSIVLGQRGEYRVIDELLVRGFVPCMPAVDIGFDLVLPSGVRIQVKSSKLVTRDGYRYKQKVYQFMLSQRRTLHRGSKSIKQEYAARLRRFSDVCDFVILWGSDEDRFWIVPSKLMDNRGQVIVGGKPRWRDIDMVKVAALQENGWTQRQIAKELGVGLSTLQFRIYGQVEPKKHHGSFVKEVNSCEDRWDLIESFGSIAATKLEEMYKESEIKETSGG